MNDDKRQQVTIRGTGETEPNTTEITEGEGPGRPWDSTCPFLLVRGATASHTPVPPSPDVSPAVHFAAPFPSTGKRRSSVYLPFLYPETTTLVLGRIQLIECK